MTAQPCTRCGRNVHDSVICNSCTSTWRTDINRLPSLLEDLETSISCQDRVTRTNRRAARVEDQVAVAAERMIEARLRSKMGRVVLAPHSLPVNLDASDLYAEITRDLRTILTTVLGVLAPMDPGNVLNQLAALVDIGRQHDDASQFVNVTHRAVRKIESAIDTDVEDVYVGPCDQPDITEVDTLGTIRVDLTTDRICGTHMYAEMGDTAVTCPTCGYVYDIADRKAWMLEAIRDVWARPALIASSLSNQNMTLSLDKLKNWISRDKATHKTGRARQDETGAWVNPHTGLKLILTVGTDYQDENGVDVMEPVRDTRGEPVLDADGRPVLKQAGQPLFRIGDVIDRCDALRLQAHKVSA